jgi:hypothetical protein
VYKTGREGAGQIEVEIIDLLDGSVESLTDDAPDDAPGLSDNGNGNVVGADNWLNRITFRNLATPHTVRPLFNFNNMWDNAFHISQLADDERRLQDCPAVNSSKLQPTEVNGYGDTPITAPSITTITTRREPTSVATCASSLSPATGAVVPGVTFSSLKFRLSKPARSSSHGPT